MPVTGSPSTATSPPVAGCRPETSERVVDLPQPVGPTTVTNSPRRTVEVDVADGGAGAAVLGGEGLGRPGEADGGRVLQGARVVQGGSGAGRRGHGRDRRCDVGHREPLSTLREQCAQVPFCAFCSRVSGTPVGPTVLV